MDVEMRANTGEDFLEVYVAAMPEADVLTADVENAERQAEFSAIRNEAVLREKYFVWRLLEYAVRHHFGKGLDDFIIRREESGKWTATGFELSLSHSSGALAVAVSSLPVGVDIERLVPPRAKNFAEKVLSERERSAYLDLPLGERDERIVELWSMKESLFKRRGRGAFVPRELETGVDTLAVRVTVGGERFVLSVASAVTDRLILCTNTESEWYDRADF